MFASNTGLKMLSESVKLHLDVTFHTKSKYFAQLYKIHAYFSPKIYDKQHPDRVWVKRMIPCVWSFMKRSRIKDYVKLFKFLVKEAKKYGYTLKPNQAIIDFELAAKKAYEQVFIGIVVKGCLFHFGQSLFKIFYVLGLKSY